MTTTQFLCGRCCSHGGMCTLPGGHDGRHDAGGYCQWPDDESITRAEADAILLSSGRPEARALLDLQEGLEGLLGIEPA